MKTIHGLMPRLLCLALTVFGMAAGLGAKDIVWKGEYFGNVKSSSINDEFTDLNTVYLYNVGQKKFINVAGSYDAEPVLSNVGMKMIFADCENLNGRMYIRTSINNSNNRFCLGLAGNPDDASQPVRVLCDLQNKNHDASTEGEIYLYSTNSGWYITPVSAGSKKYYIRNSRTGNIESKDHLRYNPSTNRIDVADDATDENAQWMFISPTEYRGQILALREGSIEVTAFINDSQFSRNNRWEGSWKWLNTGGLLHNIGESDDLCDDNGNVLRAGYGIPSIQTWTDTSRGGIGVNYYSQFNVAEIKGETNRLSQTITGLPAGLYRVSCQAFFFDGHDGNTTNSSCYLFANSERTTLRPRNDISNLNVSGSNTSAPVTYVYAGNGYGQWAINYDGSDSNISNIVYKHTYCTKTADGKYPTDGMAAGMFFLWDDDNCENSVVVNIREGESLTIGVNKGTADGWVAADHFRLFYLGNYESVLDEDAMPSQTITDDLNNANVNLRRTLGKGWTSIVLPFDVTQAQFDETFGSSAVISELYGVDPDMQYRMLFKTVSRVADNEVFMHLGRHYIISGAKDPAVAASETYGFIINNNDNLRRTVSGPLYQFSNIRRTSGHPQPIILDLRMHDNGYAFDHSDTHHKVDTYMGGNLASSLNKRYGRNEARFANTWGGTATDSYYDIDYSSSAASMKTIEDAHSTAVLVKPGTNGTAEAAVMSSVSQGTGLGMFVKDGKFLYKLYTSSGETTVGSTTAASPDRYYHVVATWEKSTRKLKIYVDGKLEAEATAGSDVMLSAKSGNHLITIGCNPDNTCAFNGSVALARIYAKTLSASEVKDVYDDLEPLADVPEIKHTVSCGRDRYLTFRGTYGYEEGVMAPKGSYFVSNGKVYHLTKDTKLYGFRGYIQETDANGTPLLDTPSAAAPLSMRIIGHDGAATDINAVGADGKANGKASDAIYDLRGRVVGHDSSSVDLPKGVYIVNGKKKVVK